MPESEGENRIFTLAEPPAAIFSCCCDVSASEKTGELNVCFVICSASLPLLTNVIAVSCDIPARTAAKYTVSGTLNFAEVDGDVLLEQLESALNAKRQAKGSRME